MWHFRYVVVDNTSSSLQTQFHVGQGHASLSVHVHVSSHIQFKISLGNVCMSLGTSYGMSGITSPKRDYVLAKILRHVSADVPSGISIVILRDITQNIEENVQIYTCLGGSHLWLRVIRDVFVDVCYNIPTDIYMLLPTCLRRHPQRWGLCMDACIQGCPGRRASKHLRLHLWCIWRLGTDIHSDTVVDVSGR